MIVRVIAQIERILALILHNNWNMEELNRKKLLAFAQIWSKFQRLRKGVENIIHKNQF